MKLVTAVVRPFKMDDVKTALEAVGVHGMTLTEVSGFGRQRGHIEVYRGAEYRTDWEPRVRIELAVADDLADQVTEAICNIARSGRDDDGNVFVSGLAEAIRIRTGETGASAI